MSRRLRASAAALLALLAAAGGASAQDAEALARFRKAFDPASPAPAEDRVAAAGAVGAVQGRAGPEAVLRALGETLDRIGALAGERSAAREEYLRLVGDQEMLEARSFTEEVRRRIEELKVREESLRDRDARERTVEGALRAALGRFRDPRAVEYLAGPGLRGSPHPGVRAAAAEALGGAGDPSAARALAAATKDRDAVVREAALGALARLRAREQETLRLLASALEDPRWTTRLEAARRLADLATPASVDLLVARLAGEDGRLRADLAALLRGLTGQGFGVEPEGWAHWWRENREEYASGRRTLGGGGGRGGPLPAGGAAPGDTVSYYGITVHSRRILYVIDISGSMTKPGTSRPDVPKVEDAKRELLRSIRELDPGSAFTVYAFHDTVRKWRPALAKATAEAKEDARRWIEALGASSWTNTYAALEEALRASAANPGNDMGEDYALAADTVFLLTDGSPTTSGGQLKDARGNPEYPRVLEAVRAWNREKRVAIHAIGVGPEINTDFLSTLAGDNGGQFVTVK